MKTFILLVNNTNLFPHTIKPISIQVPQHVSLLQQAIQENVAVAVAFHVPDPSPGSRFIAGYGYPYIADTRADGSVLIYIHGVGKVNLARTTLIPSAEVTYVDAEVITESTMLSDEMLEKYKTLSRYFGVWVDRYIQDAGQKEFFLSALTGPAEVVSACAAYLVKDFEIQYELMEIFDINQQIEYLHRLWLSNQLIS